MIDDKFGMSNTALKGVPIELRVSVGRAKPTLRELLDFRCDDVIPLDTRIEDHVDIMIGERLIAKGELIADDGNSEGNISVRLTEIIDRGSVD